MLTHADLGWAQIPADAGAFYRRAVIGEAPAPEGVEAIRWDQDGVHFLEPSADCGGAVPRQHAILAALHEVLVYHVVERLKPEALVRFWPSLYQAMKPGGIVRIHGVYWSHFDVGADPTRYRGLSERMFGYLSALGREQLRRDPFEDDVGLRVYNGVDFESKSMEHILEPEWEGRSDEARIWATQHHVNVVRRLTVILETHKPCRRPGA